MLLKISSHRRCSKDVLKNFAKVTGKHLYQSLFFNKGRGLRPATSFKKRGSGTGVFLWILRNFSKQLFYRTHSDNCFYLNDSIFLWCSCPFFDLLLFQKTSIQFALFPRCCQECLLFFSVQLLQLNTLLLKTKIHQKINVFMDYVQFLLEENCLTKVNPLFFGVHYKAFSCRLVWIYIPF